MKHTSKTRILCLVLAGLAVIFLASWDFVLPLPETKSAPVFDSYDEQPSENDQWIMYQNDPREPAEVLSVVPADKEK